MEPKDHKAVDSMLGINGIHGNSECTDYVNKDL